MITAVAVNPSVDRFVVVPHVVPGQIHRPTSVVAVAGGKGFNAARAAASLGSEVTAVGFLGGHPGRWIADAIRAAGIRLLAVDCEGDTRTSLSAYGEDDGTMTEFYEPGKPVSAANWEELAAHVRTEAGRSSWVAISGSLPAGTPDREVVLLIEAARSGGARVAVDLRGGPLVEALRAGVDLVKVNATEASAALETLGSGARAEATVLPVLGSGSEEIPPAPSPAQDALVGSARALAGEGATARVAVVTAGWRGAAMWAGGGAWTCTVGETGPYPVGSGDAFLGGFVGAAEELPGDWERAFRRGMAAGIANAFEPGAGRLDPARARTLEAQLRPRRWERHEPTGRQRDGEDTAADFVRPEGAGGGAG